MVVGEASGDLLAAGLMQALKAQLPNPIRFVGIGGPKMVFEGFENLFPMERLAVMGITEVLSRLPELLRIRKRVAGYFANYKPAIFIGVDAPDFNLRLEYSLKQYGIKTVHYVSPSVWAWRQDRVFTIKRSVDLLLALFPFEAEFYQKHSVAVKVVGHPLADLLPLECDTSGARDRLDLIVDKGEKVLAILPGSRRAEVENIAPIFVRTMIALSRKRKDIIYWFPSANREREEQLKKIIHKEAHSQNDGCYKNLPIRFSIGNAREVMAASDAVLLASGTATLEAMLLKKPMVAGYKWGMITHAIISRMVKVPNVTLPNLLAGESIIPELIQDDCTPDRLLSEVERSLNQETFQTLLPKYKELHSSIKKDANASAAEAILSLLFKVV